MTHDSPQGLVMLAATADLLSPVSLELITPQIMLPAPWALKGPLPGGQLCSRTLSWLPERLDLGRWAEGTWTLATETAQGT